MARYSQIIITFEDVDQALIDIGTQIDFAFYFEDNTWLSNRCIFSTISAQNRFVRGSNAVNSAINFAKRWNLDWPSPSGLGLLSSAGTVLNPPYGLIDAIAVQSNNKVYITCKSYGYDHVIPYISPIYGNDDTTVVVSFDVINEIQPGDVFEVDSITYGKDAEGNYNYTRCNILVDNEVFPITVTGIKNFTASEQANLFTYVQRVIGGYFYLTDNTGATASVYKPTIDDFTTGIGLEPTIVYSSNGATVMINVTVVKGELSTTIQYSLDNITFQTGNTFYGLDEGDYTIYIKDEYSEAYSWNFHVETLPVSNKPEPYFNISKNQSFTCKEVTTFDELTSFPNYFNALYEQQNYYNQEYHPYCSLFNDTDTVKLQLQNTYDNVTINVIDESTNEIAKTTTASKIAQYIGLTDSRDCYIKSGGTNKTYIYFVSGNIYDYSTGSIINSYILSGRLESWMYDTDNIQYVILNDTTSMNGTYVVSGRSYDSVSGVSVLIIDANYTETSDSTACICKTMYNAEDFDIWESSVSMATLDGNYHLQILATDDDTRYEDIEWVSESFNVNSKQSNTILIKWSDSKVIGDLDFSTSIENICRIKGKFNNYIFEGDKETMEDDLGRIIPLKSVKKDKLKLETHAIPAYIIDKLTTAISQHDSVIINSLPIQTAEFGEANQLEGSSLMTLTIECQYNVTTTYLSDSQMITSESGYNILGTSTNNVLGV